MRGGLLPLLVLLTACNPGVPQPRTPEDKATEIRNAPVLAPEAVTPPANDAAPANDVAPEQARPPGEDPGLASMTPYRRREYERGWRDCMAGNFDGERQGESYRIGCMAAAEARDRQTR